MNFGAETKFEKGASEIRVPSLQYVIFTSCNVVVLTYCNVGWCVKDSAVHRSQQQWVVAEWLGPSVAVRVRVRAREWNFSLLFFFSTEHQAAGTTKRPLRTFMVINMSQHSHWTDD